MQVSSELQHNVCCKGILIPQFEKLEMEPTKANQILSIDSQVALQHLHRLKH